MFARWQRLPLVAREEVGGAFVGRRWNIMPFITPRISQLVVFSRTQYDLDGRSCDHN